jgi:hypothetical protein
VAFDSAQAPERVFKPVACDYGADLYVGVVGVRFA